MEKKKTSRFGIVWGWISGGVLGFLLSHTLCRPACSQFRFRFFIQCIKWSEKDLEKEVAKNVWMPAKVKL